MNNEIHVVTGAFGYSGKYITQRLLNEKAVVRTITNSTNRINPFGELVKALPYNFNDPDKLTESLKGAKVLYNTYWIRYNHKLFKHADAINNTLTLFDCAKKAGVERIVHISIANPTENSPLEYYRGKAILEKALIETGIPYAILRPTVLFGGEDILVNNIAWSLRHLPVFGYFGDGKYHIQPIHVDDLASLAVEHGKHKENIIIDAVGPENFEYKTFVRTIAKIIGAKSLIIPTPPTLGYWITWMIGKVVDDVMITPEEVKGLMGDLLCSKNLPTGATILTKWVEENKETLGVKYASELARRKDRLSSYENL